MILLHLRNSAIKLLKPDGTFLMSDLSTVDGAV